VKYEPLYERFTAVGPTGSTCDFEFLKSGFLTMGDKPELFFFRATGGDVVVGMTDVVVGISGDALRRFERGKPQRLSREEKIDITGLWLKRQWETGEPLDSAHLLIRDDELARLTGELGLS
jgi:hypothetical protein